jgi:hypothetical protein
MRRFGLILAVMLFVPVAVAMAGELDAEYAGKARTVNAAPVLDKPSSELDAESPTQTCCFKRWLCGYPRYRYVSYSYCGYGYGYGYGGFGGYGVGFGYGGYGGGSW